MTEALIAFLESLVAQIEEFLAQLEEPDPDPEPEPDDRLFIPDFQGSAPVGLRGLGLSPGDVPDLGTVTADGEHITIGRVYADRLVARNGGSITAIDSQIGTVDPYNANRVVGRVDMTRCEVIGGQDGVKFGGDIIQCHIHSMSGQAHGDGVQAENGVGDGHRIAWSHIDCRRGSTLNNAALFIKPQFSPSLRITVEDNYLNGGNYTTYFKQGNYRLDAVVRRNLFGLDHRYGYVSRDSDGITWHDNRDVNGVPV